MIKNNNWKRFEEEAIKYLRENYSAYAEFKKEGGSDSTTTDILVTTDKNEFYIETKSPKAQSGQFVVIPDQKNEKFIFSEKNKTEENKLTENILKYMDDNWDNYKDVSTKSLGIEMPSNIFANWITDYYKSKGAKYFISKENDDFVIIHIDDFYESFDIKANYRIKRSGTRPLPDKYKDDVENFFKSLYKNVSITKKDKHYYIDVNNNLDKKYYEISSIYDVTFYLSKDNNYPKYYRISVISKTNNPNVIFSIDLKPNISGINQNDFIDQLNDN